MKESPHAESHAIWKAIDSLGISVVDDGKPDKNRKFGLRLFANVSLKPLLLFWECSTSPATISGFVGRYEGMPRSEKITALQNAWTKELIEELDTMRHAYWRFSRLMKEKKSPRGHHTAAEN